LNVGVKYIRAGVGAGSRCLTRVVTGFGYPQASCIHELYQEFSDDIVIISDGGAKNTGDVVKGSCARGRVCYERLFVCRM